MKMSGRGFTSTRHWVRGAPGLAPLAGGRRRRDPPSASPTPAATASGEEEKRQLKLLPAPAGRPQQKRVTSRPRWHGSHPRGRGFEFAGAGSCCAKTQT
jgi:hypothetical protein